jgi:hypothetical protein
VQRSRRIIAAIAWIPIVIVSAASSGSHLYVPLLQSC